MSLEAETWPNISGTQKPIWKKCATVLSISNLPKLQQVSKTIPFLFVLCIAGLLPASAATAKPSYSNTLTLDLNGHIGSGGVDIWMTRDKGQSWVLIGKTFGNETSYQYRSRKEGVHGFHFHKRAGKSDGFRPNKNSRIHELIELGKLEEENQHILYSNSRLLSVEYTITDATRKIGKFESWLYVTKDSGRSWKYYGADQDGQSPMSFMAERDGLYGFKVVSTDIAGQQEQAPGPGSRPDILVRIDTNKPVVQLLSPQPLDIWEPGTNRLIRWRADDELIDRKSGVSLYYSIGNNLDWQELATQLPTDGHYRWKIPESKNGKIYLRVVAIDKAKNKGSAETAEPFLTYNILEKLLDPDKRRLANKYYETATICRINEQYPKSIKYFRLCLQLNPYHVKAHNDMGLTLLQLNEPRQAFEHYEKGLKYSPSNRNILTNLSRLYLDHNQLNLANQILVRLTHLYPKSYEGLWMLSQLKMEQGKVESARKYWKRLTEIDFPRNDPRWQKIVADAKEQLAKTSAVSSELSDKGLLFNLGIK